jgi:hypothetical protein
MWASVLSGASSASNSAGLQMGGNIGNQSVKSKNNQILFNVLDYGGGLSQTINKISGGKLFGDDEEDEMNLEDYLVYKQLPDYAESDAARKTWSEKLQSWASDENYGAIPSNWDEIWSTAKDRINRYYWGGVNDTGLAGKVKASAARRGASDSPALENQLVSLGQQESIDMNELATTIGTKQADLAESGRQTWLSSLSNLANLKPSYITSSGVTQAMQSYLEPEYTSANATSDIGSGLLSLFAQYAANNNASASTGTNSTMPTSSGSSVTGSNFNLGSLLDAYNKYSAYN